jgi:two-component system chemotaxis response regulator CheB
VLVVDDSAFARTVISRLLRDAGIDVIGTAHDGGEALAAIAETDPDLVTLDLTMPHVDGLAVLRELRGRPRPRVLVVSVSSIDTDLGAEALALGAIDLVAKPTAIASDRLNEIAVELVAKVYAASVRGTTAAIPRENRRTEHRARLVLIGTSTGGPQALTRVLSSLPAGLAAPVAMALHIPGGYTEALAKRLDKISPLEVVEARDGMVLRPGLAVLAPGGMNLRVDANGSGELHARVSPLPLTPFKPSVDELFESGAAAVGGAALGVVLTGMGDDGLAGARAIADAGGALLAEAASSCVVYGMPRTVLEANLGARSIPLDAMAEEIAKHV